MQASAQASQTSQPAESADKPEEPELKLVECEWPVKDAKTGKERPCGGKVRSLVPHLKMHKVKIGRVERKLNKEDYLARFPNAEMGRHPFDPTPADIEKMQVGFEAYREDLKDIRIERVDRPKRVEARTQELWEQCARDIAVLQFCRNAAEDEELIRDVRRKLNTAYLTDNTTAKVKEQLNDDLTAIEKRYQATMNALNLTVEKRTKANNLGSDTVAQLVSNFANVWRKYPPDMQQLFRDRVARVKAVIAERVRQRYLSQVEDVEETQRIDDSDESVGERIKQIGRDAGVESL